MFSRPFVEFASDVPAMMDGGCVPIPASWSFLSQYKYFKFDEPISPTDMPACSLSNNYSVFSDASCTEIPHSRPSHAIATVPSERPDCWSTSAGTYFSYCNMSDSGLPWMTAVSSCYAPVTYERRYPWVETRTDASRLLNGSCVSVPASWGWPADWRYYKFHKPVSASVMPVCSGGLDSFTETHWDGPTCSAPAAQVYVQTWYRLSNTCWLNSKHQYFEFHCAGYDLMYSIVGPGCIADTFYQATRAGSWDGGVSHRGDVCIEYPSSWSLPNGGGRSARWYEWDTLLTGQDLLWCTTTTTTATFTTTTITNTSTITNTTSTTSTTSATTTYTTETISTTTMTHTTSSITTTATTITVEAITIHGTLVMSVQNPAIFAEEYSSTEVVAVSIAATVGVDASDVRVVLSPKARRLQSEKLGDVAANYYITVQKTTVAGTTAFAEEVMDRIIAMTTSELSIQINEEILARYPSQGYAVTVFSKSVPTIAATDELDEENKDACGKSAVFSFIVGTSVLLARAQNI